MIPIIQKHIDKIREYCESYDVKNLYVFGSAVKTNFNQKSDIDLLIGFKNITIEKYTDNYFKLYELFEKLFNRKIDLITENSLSNPYFISEIKKNRFLVYEARN